MVDDLGINCCKDVLTFATVSCKATIFVDLHFGSCDGMTLAFALQLGLSFLFLFFCNSLRCQDFELEGSLHLSIFRAYNVFLLRIAELGVHLWIESATPPRRVELRAWVKFRHLTLLASLDHKFAA